MYMTRYIYIYIYIFIFITTLYILTCVFPNHPSSAKVPCYQNEVGMPSSALGVFFYEHIAAIIVPVSAAERPSSIRQKSSHQLGANVSNLNDRVYDKKLCMPIFIGSSSRHRERPTARSYTTR